MSERTFFRGHGVSKILTFDHVGQSWSNCWPLNKENSKIWWKTKQKKFHDERSFEEKFREKSLLETIIEKRFVLGRLKVLNPFKLMIKIMKWM